MDRFIVQKGENMEFAITSLKSNMDRFIVVGMVYCGLTF